MDNTITKENPITNPSESLITEESPIKITEKAAAQIQKLHAELPAESAPENKQFRVFISAGGCSGFEYGMAFDEAGKDDETSEYNGVKYIIDKVSLEYMRGSIIDFDDSLTGKGFEIQNPNAKSSCGCGRSFN